MENVTVCVGVKNRTFFLVKCLIESMKKCLHHEHLELSVFDCGTDDVEDLETVIKENWSGPLKFKQEKIEFSRSYTFNRAIKNSATEYVFLCDADMILPQNFLEQFFQNVAKEKAWFPICFSLLKNKPFVTDDTKNGWWREAGYGMVGISKNVFFNSGGLSEKYIAWGGEDNDFYNRVKVQKTRSKCIGLFHSWHCSEYNSRTTPERFRREVTRLDIIRPKYVLAITTFNRRDYLRNCIETWLSTRNIYADWTLIVADDGSTDGSLEYLDNLKLLFKKVIIKNSRRGVHHQVNQIIKYLEKKDFDVCFKCDDDIMFLQPGWDDEYCLAIKKYKYDHLVFHDERWIGGRFRGGKHRFKKDVLLSRVDAQNTQGAFYTITPRVIKAVGYFDLSKFGLCGLGHIDYTARCCRAGFNNFVTVFDIKDSNKYLKLIIRNYTESPNEFRHVENTPPLLRIKTQAIANKNRVYIGYNESNRFLTSAKGKVVYLLPSNKISGGVAVVIKHANLLRENGYNVFLLSVSEDEKHWVVWTDNNVPIFSIKSIAKHMLEGIDVLIMTYWETVKTARVIDAKRKIYFVQSDERRFYSSKDKIQQVQSTYVKDFEYMTEAKWIQKWLKDEFHINAHYVPNGIDLDLFYKTEDIKKKIKPRVLLEGALTIPFKGVADAYQAVKDLNCEIWIVSNDGTPPKNWRCNEFFQAVPMSKMREIYSSCDVMLKMSRIEGFFGPPMEAMACGCAVVVGKCSGYDEYIVPGQNALAVEIGDIKAATHAVKRLLENVSMRNRLISNGFETVKQWSWNQTLNNLKVILGEKKQEELEMMNICEIIIVAHNALPYLQRCIESIEKYTNCNYKITVVNNNSNYEMKSYLKSLTNVKVISNAKNYGFGYANNQAIRESSAKYICFLNSDTIVTKNWLSKLIKILENNAVGLVGPVSNYVSSEIQLVEFLYQHSTNANNDTEIQDFAKQREHEYSLQTLETNRLVGFCMVTKKEILEKSGIFDDRYEFNFEDDDLGLRIIEQGYKLLCSLDTFIYHFGGQTFKDRFNQVTYNPSLEKSKGQYLEKWYNTGRIKKLHEEYKKPSIVYLLASNAPSGGVKVVFEHANRLSDRGYNVTIYCGKDENNSWFNLYAPIHYFVDQSEIPRFDIAIGTYFSTLPVLQKIKAKVKIHLCQGYEAALYTEPLYAPLVQTIKDDYRKIREKIVVSKWLKEIIDSEFEVESYYVPNGIDQYVFSLSKHERNKTPRILIVGNLNLEFKGVQVALRAATNFLKTVRGTIVRLASEKTKIDVKYEFHNMSVLSQDEIAKIFASCDVIINAPYKVEGFSLPPLEAMASGTPVITTDCGGVNDYAENSKNALIIPSQNVHAIEHALKLLFTNDVLYSRLVENGLKTAKGFLWYSSIDKLEDYLHRLYQKFIDSQKEQLSVCMIVKNEEDCLASCLESIKDIANEIVVVDTGSTDDTIRIAKKFGAVIYHFNWIDDFSAARNFSLKKATQQWTLILDADETINKQDLKKLKELLRGPEMAYLFSTRNYLRDRNAEGLITCDGEYKNEEEGYIGWCRSDKIRLFPTNSKIEFSGHIHELVEPSIENLGLETKLCDIPIHHYSKLNKKKSEEYLKLSKKKFEACKNNPKALYELATQFMSLNNNDEALVIWRKLLEFDPKNHDVLAHLGTVYNLLSDYEQAERYFLKSLEIEQSEYAHKHLGICYAKQEKYEDAYFAFKKIVYSTKDLKTMADFSFCCNVLKKYDEGIVVLEKCLKINREETISWNLLEILYNEKGIELVNKNKFLIAVRMFKSALSINPNFDIAKTNLSVLNKLMEAKQFSKKFIK